ncbi:hypothetical protein N657DRAFT_677011 [Parathielavia appendiculata]|uniref:SET domain-containing protein n=1 Tax=Parathielavia appendiculata TaxID=2587402 RepID=A0AAN6UAC6_9PEZI|nr:hypothetical protein N657DRAFT_677011 [Parathielavia appendiculata]
MKRKTEEEQIQELLESAGAEGAGDILDKVLSLAAVRCRQEAGPECEDGEDAEEELANEIRELLEPIPAGVTGGDGTAPQSPVEERVDCPPAPPPSPAGSAQETRPKLKKGEIILVESPLLRTAHFRLMLDYANLSDEAKKAYLSLHGAENGDLFSRVERIKKFNAFAVPGGIAIFEIASRFNHACPSVRNVQYVYDDEEGVIELIICKDMVPAGAELRISYGGSPIELYRTYGFRCSCGGCTPLTDEDIRRLEDQEYSIPHW